MRKAGRWVFVLEEEESQFSEDVVLMVAKDKLLSFSGSTTVRQVATNFDCPVATVQKSFRIILRYYIYKISNVKAVGINSVYVCIETSFLFSLM
ncbi:hypothetical protein AVEN_70681-1 [Araneus ventricosus]|uniref:Uncharacterized protein n=1 Tax=Araneus ventricosus TaxID=182803 RepID=A0A4Y2KQA5_ARAVE|nr:hypothetical protein AVEN_70681-1 [Araneus ventricosus]